MTPELENAIARTKELFRERDRPEDWSQNIIEGSAGLSNKDDWTRYYTFLTNPNGFNPNAPVGKCIDPNTKIEPLPPSLVSYETQNGTETIIHVKNVARLSEQSEQDDEKLLEC